MADQVSGSLTKAINSEVGMAFSRVAMFLALPGLGLLGFLVHDWVTSPVTNLANRTTALEQLLTQVATAQHSDELKIGVMQNSMDLGRADRLAASDDTKQSLSAVNAKEDQLQSSVATLTSSVAGIAATLDAMKR